MAYISMESSSKHIYRYVINLLAKRDYSEVKLREKLNNRGFRSELVNSVLTEVKEKGYLSEDRYIEARIKSLMYKNYSPSYIQYKLKAEKLNVAISLIKEIFLKYGISEQIQINNLIVKKLAQTIKAKSDIELKYKIDNYLRSRGHISPGRTESPLITNSTFLE